MNKSNSQCQPHDKIERGGGGGRGGDRKCVCLCARMVHASVHERGREKERDEFK